MLTLEVFCERILKMSKDDEKITKKYITGVALKLLLLITAVSIMLGYLIGCVLPILGGVGGFILGVIIYFSLLDYISEEKFIFDKWAKVSNFWWLAFIVCIVAILMMKLFWR